MEFLEVCKVMKEIDENFICEYIVSGNNKVENIVWIYKDFFFSYFMFGDVVFFEIIYRLIIYGMIFGVFFGINNNGSMIFFGCVLL